MSELHRNTGMSVTFKKLTELESVAQSWKALERHSNPSVFQSWAWMGPWLQRALGSEELLLCTVSRGEELAGLAVFTMKIQRNRRLFPIKTLYLNESGPGSFDFCIEYNGILVRQTCEKEVWEAVLGELTRKLHPWEELIIRRADRDGTGVHEVSSEILVDAGLERLVIDTTDSQFVNLETIRRSGKDFIQTLSSNRRAQIRRSLKAFKKEGEITVKAASSIPQAQDFFTELKRLHQLHWNRRGQPGAFAKPGAQEFHREIIGNEFERGGIQLLKIAAGETPFGYIYSLVRNGWVYMIQTGFNYQKAKTRPGEVSHFLAIEWNLRTDNRAYDFLGGESRYKSSLSNSNNTLDTIVLRRRSLKLLVEDNVRRLYRFKREKAVRAFDTIMEKLPFEA